MDHDTDREAERRQTKYDFAMRHRQEPNGTEVPGTILKGSRRARKRMRLDLAKQWTPHFLADADSRLSVVRTIRRRIETLKSHCNADSYQKEVLCSRAVFVAVLIETLETKAMQGEPFEPGSYSQLVNTLTGLLKSLGLDRKLKRAGDLKSYLEEREEA